MVRSLSGRVQHASRVASRRRGLAIGGIALITVALSFAAAWHEAGFVLPPDASGSQERLAARNYNAHEENNQLSAPGRRDVANVLLAGFSGWIAGTVSNAPAAFGRGSAIPPRPVRKEDLDRLAMGYSGLKYLTENWVEATRACALKSDAEIKPENQAGVQSPNICEARPDRVSYYIGLRDMKDDLFNTQQLWIDIQASEKDLVDPKSEDEFQEAAEEFENRKNAAQEMAYTSVWAIAQPGGGRDRQEDYLLKAKDEVFAATAALKKAVTFLKLDIPPYDKIEERQKI